MDKVQKIRKELERLREQLQDKVETSDFIAGEAFIMNYFLTFIDSLQEGPVSIDFEQELYKAFGQIKDFTLGIAIAKRFYDMGRKYNEPVSEDLEEACEQLAENARKHKAETSSPFFSQTDYRQGVMDGAKWQIAKLMTNVIDAQCFGFQGAALFSFRLPADNYLVGSKVKVILINED